MVRDGPPSSGAKFWKVPEGSGRFRKVAEGGGARRKFRKVPVQGSSSGRFGRMDPDGSEWFWKVGNVPLQLPGAGGRLGEIRSLCKVPDGPGSGAFRTVLAQGSRCFREVLEGSGALFRMNLDGS